MAIDKTKLSGVEKVYPLNVSPYEQYMGDFQNPSVASKINAMIQSLHQIGRLTNETVSQWNNVMKWIVEGGMDEIAETITNEKVTVALNEVMRMLDVSLDNGLKELAENVTETKIDVLLKSGQFESMVSESLAEINEVVEGKLEGFNLQLAETATKQELQQVSLSYKESYDTLALLQAAYPSGDNYNHTVKADGMIYTYAQGVWKSTGIQANGTGIANGTISEEKTTFFEQSENLFNKSDPRIVTGKYLTTSGAVADYASASISHPIPAKANDVISAFVNPATFGGSTRFHLYDISGNNIGNVTPTLVGQIGTATLPNNANIASVKFNIKTDTLATVMFVKSAGYPTEYISYHRRLINSILLNEKQIEQVESIVTPGVDPFIANSPLYGKTYVQDGDSIANDIHGAQDGWAGRIAAKYSMPYTNYAIDGATVTAGVLTTGGGNRHWVSRNVQNYRTDADYIILEGGTNDADLIGVNNMGTISYGFDAVLDDTTFTGAVESTLKQAILKYPGKKIGFILAHRSGSIDQQIPRRAFFDRIIECCEKWGVPYLDIFKLSYLNSDLPSLKATYFIDKSHLSDAGYDLITPLVEKWMKTL